MNKLKLRLDDLLVESFETGDIGLEERGTVRGRAETGLPTELFTCPVTCDSTCPRTCNSCWPMHTCSPCAEPTVGDTCMGTCSCDYECMG